MANTSKHHERRGSAMPAAWLTNVYMGDTRAQPSISHAGPEPDDRAHESIGEKVD